MIDIDLDHLRAIAQDDVRSNKCGYWCNGCGAFYTMTGYGKPWHEPGCPIEDNTKLHTALTAAQDRVKVLEGLLERARESGDPEYQFGTTLLGEIDAALYTPPAPAEPCFRYACPCSYGLTCSLTGATPAQPSEGGL